MNVTRENFNVIYPELRAKILSCSYMSIDEEMTGIESSDYKLRNKVDVLRFSPHKFTDSHEDATNLNKDIFSENR